VAPDRCNVTGSAPQGAGAGRSTIVTNHLADRGATSACREFAHPRSKRQQLGRQLDTTGSSAMDPSVLRATRTARIEAHRDGSSARTSLAARGER
jgi:hypothetical protein